MPGDYVPPPGDKIPQTGKFPFLETLPELKQGESQIAAAKKLVLRGSMIRDEIARLAREDELGRDQIDWTHIFTSYGQYSAKVPVMTDALKLDGVRVNVSFRDAQNIADILGVYLLTPKIADEINKAALIKVQPNAHSDWMTAGTGAYLQRMIDHSVGVDGLIAKAVQPSPDWPSAPGWNDELLNNPGKYWVNTTLNWNKPGYGANYGWYSTKAPGGKLWQNVANWHDVSHVDYSQVFRAIGPEIEITDGVSGAVFKVPTSEALTSPKWAALVSNEGPLPAARHPNIAPFKVIA